MKTQIVNGKQIAGGIEENLQSKVLKLKSKNGAVPGLVSVIVGNDPNSHKFVNLKAKAAERVGIRFEKKAYPENFDPRKVSEYIRQKNADPSTHGIIVQLPLPTYFDRTQILKAIHPFKDVDCLHPKNLGLLMMGKSVFVPPVVRAVVTVLSGRNNFLAGKPLENVAALQGSQITIVGGGLLVGKPLAIYLMNTGATVTVANKFTKNLARVTRSAEIIISATGVPNLITAEHVTKDAVVIDVAGDVDTDSVSQKASVLVPSPGGIGPLTITYLLQNTCDSFIRSLS